MLLAVLHTFSYTLRTKINPYPDVHILLPTTQSTSDFGKNGLKCCVCVSPGEALSGVGSGSDSPAHG